MLQIYNWSKTSTKTKQTIMQRAMLDLSAVKENVAKWMDIVKTEGDAGIVKYNRQYDPSYDQSQLQVTNTDIEKAYKSVSPEVIKILKRQISISRQNALSKVRQETVLK